MKRKIILTAFFISLFIPLALSSQETISAKTTINWRTAVIDISITAALPPEINVLPEAKIKAENEIEDAIPIIIQTAMEDVILNSQLNVFERLKKDLHLTSLIDNFSNEKYKVRTNLSKNLQKLQAHYQIPLYPDFCSTFIEHQVATPLPKIMHYVPSANYTGIVIYASEELPVYGEHRKEYLTPALFPKILNSNGEIIFTPENMDPDILKKQGAVHYVSHLDEVPVQRAGLLPLKIKATAVYGRNRTDLIIPSWISEKILAREHNINLLKEGKIIIVCNPEKIEADQFFNK